jgi:hypothetical protein
MRILPCRVIAVLVVALSAVTALPLAAQSVGDLAGSWTFDAETPRGAMTHTLTFAMEDGVWVGTMRNERRSFTLQDVVFADGRLTFAFEAGPPPGRGGQGGGGQGQPGQGSRPQDSGGERPSQKRTFEGVLNGDEITGEMEGPRGSMALVLSRRER